MTEHTPKPFTRRNWTGVLYPFRAACSCGWTGWNYSTRSDAADVSATLPHRDIAHTAQDAL